MDPGCVVRGCVRNQGAQPIADCRVSTFESSALHHVWVRTDAAGNYELSGLPVGPGSLEIWCSGYKGAEAVVVCVVDQAVVCDVELRRDLVLHGRIVDQHGRGVRGMVNAIDANGMSVGMHFA